MTDRVAVASRGWGNRQGAALLFDRNDDTGVLTAIDASGTIPELMALCRHPNLDILYGVSGVRAGRVHTWAVGGGRLIPGHPATVSSGGAEPCQVMVSPDGGYLCVANYGATGPGSIGLLRLAADGSIAAPARVLRRTTPPGPVADRQAVSHIHQVVPTASGRAFVTDLGADQILDYRFTAMGFDQPRITGLPPGTGPRHVVTAPDGRLFATAELASAVITLDPGPDEMTLTKHRPSSRTALPSALEMSLSPNYAISPAGAASGPINYPSDLVLVGNRLYVANRGADTVAIFHVSAREGAVLIDEVPSGGRWPTNLEVIGRHLYVANRDSDAVSVFEIDSATGELTLLDRIDVVAPMWVLGLS